MRKFLMLTGTHSETQSDGTLKIYTANGDNIVETEKDLCAIWNKNGQEPRFQEIT